MAELKLDWRWLDAGSLDPESRWTTALWSMRVGSACLTRHQDLWSQTLRDDLTVSLYPLARWIASSWWRLAWEPLPPTTGAPSFEWQYAHELGAAAGGYVWPRVVFASDGEAVSVWSDPIGADADSVRYVTGLDGAQRIPIAEFQRHMAALVDAVVQRLAGVDLPGTELAQLWQMVREDWADPELDARRRMEARLGFDPDEAPHELLTAWFALSFLTGGSALEELAPVVGLRPNLLEELAKTPGARARLDGALLKSFFDWPLAEARPWQRGVLAAQALRQLIGQPSGPLRGDALTGLLGVTDEELDRTGSIDKRKVSIARLVDDRELEIVPRKRHPVARRFELARLIGDAFIYHHGAGWLVSSDLGTARQQSQRAFAAELLCPLAAIEEFLDGDYSESGLEAAAEHFYVSEIAVLHQLENNGRLAKAAPVAPYRLVAS